jgi:ketosteroid isomerase-like protein
LRPSALAAHGNDSIRELFEASLKEGLGEVDLECAEIGMAGDFACITGHSKMLVPITTGKREEQTGKYLIVARRYAGEWKIIADSWCMDPVSVKAPAANAAVLPIRAAVK